MTLDELRKYLLPALRGLGLQETIFNAEKLDEMLSVDWYKNYHHSKKGEIPPSLSEEAKTLYRGLAGPHAQTILKAYRIRKGLEL